MKIARLIALTLLLTGCNLDSVFVEPYQFPPESYDSVEQWAMIEARRLHRDTPDNCLDVANTARAMLASQGVEAEIVTYDTRAKGSRLQHAALCTKAGVCMDNGFLSIGLYPRGEPRVAELGARN